MDRLNAFFEIAAIDGRPVEWGVNRFPDGQIQFWIEDPDGYFTSGWGTTLICSLVDSEALDLFWQIKSTLSLRSILITYLYGARCDKSRAGERAVANLPATLLSQFHVSPGGFPKVMIIAPHCDRYIHELTSIRCSPRNFEALWPLPLSFDGGPSGYSAIVFPDASAKRRYYALINRLFTWPKGIQAFAVGEKKRDQISGEISRLTLDWFGPCEYRKGPFLVIDDLCDGGATFLRIAEVLREVDPDAAIDLCVTHGVFSNGAVPRLVEVFRRIYVTNSFRRDLIEDPHRQLVVADVWKFGA